MGEGTGVVSLANVASQPIAVVRLSTTWREWPRLWKPALDKVWAAARAGRIPKPGLNVMIYRPLDGNRVDAECGVLVTEPFTDADDIVCSQTPAGTAATCVHSGGYANLAASHAAVDAWCRANGHSFGGVRWEIYGHWHDDPALVHTSIFHLTAP